MLIDLKAGASRRSRSTLPGEEGGAGPRRRHATGKAAKAESKTMYLQKSLLGGIFIFEIGICEPFLLHQTPRAGGLEDPAEIQPAADGEELRV